jgi:hypothetical protein
MNSERIKAKDQSKQCFLPISDGTDRANTTAVEPAFGFLVRSAAFQSPVRGGLPAPRAAIRRLACHIAEMVRTRWMSIASSPDRMTRRADV